MIALAFAAVAAVLHMGTAWRYGYFRDELYFIAASKHLAWGYVDQPPLVALAAWLASPFGYNLIALRVLPALAAARNRRTGRNHRARLRSGTFRVNCSPAPRRCCCRPTYCSGTS